MNDSALLRVAWGLGLTALVVSGCSNAVHGKVSERTDLQISAVGVYPFGFRWDEPAYRSFELATRLLSVANAKVGDQVMLFGPSEFKVFRSDADNAWAATNLVSVLPSYGIAPSKAAVLRSWAERRVHSSKQDLLDQKGRHKGSTIVEETTYVGHVELLHPSSGETLVELSGHVLVDPFARRSEDENDPTPELTGLMEQLVAQAFSAAKPLLLSPSPPRRLGLKLAFNPMAAFQYSEDGRTSFELRLATMDALESELLRQGRVQFANPGLPSSEVNVLTRLPGGLWVAGSEGGPLSRGDLITAVDGQPALPGAIQRARFRQGPLALKVRRPTGEAAEVTLP